MGHVDNTLAYAHSRYSVTAPAVSAGSINSIFTPNQNSRAVWNNVTSLAIEIDLLASQTAIRTIGVVFSDDFVPDWVLFETSTDGINWQQVENLPGSRATFWSSRGFIGGRSNTSVSLYHYQCRTELCRSPNFRLVER
jgi:hypothetical protein